MRIAKTTIDKVEQLVYVSKISQSQPEVLCLALKPHGEKADGYWLEPKYVL